ncbi:unnamed protein product [Nezara viridula]|uniref:Uncharacterized protein n=1 Tax=Nezara viridula TaxID=85310 RepID=A0A9P0E7Q0_NEZVI|nr:unnamed protein product [Nezara viridula]
MPDKKIESNVIRISNIDAREEDCDRCHPYRVWSISPDRHDRGKPLGEDEELARTRCTRARVFRALFLRSPPASSLRDIRSYATVILDLPRPLSSVLDYIYLSAASGVCNGLATPSVCGKGPTVGFTAKIHDYSTTDERSGDTADRPHERPTLAHSSQDWFNQTSRRTGEGGSAIFGYLRTSPPMYVYKQIPE